MVGNADGDGDDDDVCADGDGIGVGDGMVVVRGMVDGSVCMQSAGMSSGAGRDQDRHKAEDGKLGVLVFNNFCNNAAVSVGLVLGRTGEKTDEEAKSEAVVMDRDNVEKRC